MKNKEDGWFVGFVEEPDNNVVVEIFEIKDDYAHSTIYHTFDTIEDAINYYELMVRDLKGQRDNKIKFIYDGECLIKEIESK